ncbi:hypothetical protein LINPERPRIM_LOCUS36521 [Linum perenne]
MMQPMVSSGMGFRGEKMGYYITKILRVHRSPNVFLQLIPRSFK